MPEIRDCFDLLLNDDFKPFDRESTYGRFAVRLNVNAGYMMVNIRIKFKFGPLFLGTGGITAKRFREKYKRQIAEYWDGRYRLYAIGDDKKKRYIDVSITFTEVASSEKAHFVADIQRAHLGTSYVGKSSKGGANPCVLYSDAVKRRPKGNLAKLGWWATLGGSREALVMAQTAKDLSGAAVTVAFAKNSTKIQTRSAIKAVHDAYRDHMTTRPLVKLIITGYRMSDESPGLALQRAQTFEKEVLGLGFPNNVLDVRSGGIGTQLFPCVQVTIDDVSLQQILNLPNDFPIAAHEFGHKLGLLDEYPREGVDALEGEDGKVILDLAKRMGLDIPKFNSNTTSIMSVGDKVLPFHYLPFVNAAEELLNDFAGTNRAWAKFTKDAKLANAKPTVGIEKTPQPVSRQDADIDLASFFASA